MFKSSLTSALVVAMGADSVGNDVVGDGGVLLFELVEKLHERDVGAGARRPRGHRPSCAAVVDVFALQLRALIVRREHCETMTSSRVTHDARTQRTKAMLYSSQIRRRKLAIF